MSIFDAVPNKKDISGDTPSGYVWPEYGDLCEMNLFFNCFSSAEGWLGEGYLAIWSRNEVKRFREGTVENYGEKLHFFASDGGGNQFGFFADNGEIKYVCAPDIGSPSDVRILGNWEEFLSAVSQGDYI